MKTSYFLVLLLAVVQALPAESAHSIAPGPTGAGWCSLRDGHGAAAEWVQRPLQEVTVLSKSDIVQCYRVQLPSYKGGNQGVTRLRLNTVGHVPVHSAAVFDCPANSWVVQEIAESEGGCGAQISALMAVCNRWVFDLSKPLLGGSATSCTPPGLIYGHLTQQTSQDRVLIVNVHYTPDPSTYKTALTISGNSFEVATEPSSLPATPKVLGTFQGSAITPPSDLTHAMQGLAIPAGQRNATVEFICGRRCTYKPLRHERKHVSVVGVDFQTHSRGVSGQVRIIRGWLAALDGARNFAGQVKLEGGRVTQAQLTDLLGQPVKMYPGDTVEWSCSYDTSSSSSSSSSSGSSSVLGGLSAEHHEQCHMQLHYWPRMPHLTGCLAMARGDENRADHMTLYEAAELLETQGEDRQAMPLRSVYDSKTFDMKRWKGCWKATWIMVYSLTLLGAMCALKMLLCSCKWLGWIHPKFMQLPFSQQRNVCLYITHLIMDTLIICSNFTPALEVLLGWNEAGAETATGHMCLFNYLAAFYLLELAWRHHVDTMLLMHHVGTILIVTVFAGELTQYTYRYGNSLVILAVYAILEQPTYVGLLLKRMLPPSSIHVVRGMKFAAYSWFVMKAASVVTAAFSMYRDWEFMPLWAKVSFTLTWTLATVVQMWSGWMQYGIYRQTLFNFRAARKLAIRKKGDVTSELDQDDDDVLQQPQSGLRSPGGSSDDTLMSGVDQASDGYGSYDGMVSVDEDAALALPLPLPLPSQHYGIASNIY